MHHAVRDNTGHPMPLRHSVSEEKSLYIVYPGGWGGEAVYTFASPKNVLTVDPCIFVFTSFKILKTFKEHSSEYSDPQNTQFFLETTVNSVTQRSISHLVMIRSPTVCLSPIWFVYSGLVQFSVIEIKNEAVRFNSAKFFPFDYFSAGSHH